MDKQDKLFWLISIPGNKPGMFEQQQKRTEKDAGLCTNYKVGTLDSLMSLSDDLQKIDIFVEGVVKKIAKHFYEFVDKVEPMVRQATPEHYLTHFQWDEAKYNSRAPIKELVQQISVETSKLDEELRVNMTEYNAILQAIAANERKASGSLLVRSLHDIVKPSDWLDTEHLTTLFVVVPKHMQSDWENTYERLTDYVVPRSSTVIASDQEYLLCSVRLFKKVVDDFKNLAREKRFIVRDFQMDEKEAASGEQDRKKLESDKETLQHKMVLWCKVNFGEAFANWTHLKCIRLFVESVLRYGLPVNFLAILMRLNKRSNDRKLRDILNQMYANLGTGGTASSKSEDDPEEFYPYVFLPMDLNFKPTM